MTVAEAGDDNDDDDDDAYACFLFLVAAFPAFLRQPTNHKSYNNSNNDNQPITSLIIIATMTTNQSQVL